MTWNWNVAIFTRSRWSAWQQILRIRETFMRYATAAVITCTTLLASLGATQGQEASMEGDAMSSPGAMELPDACQGQDAPSTPEMGSMSPDMGAMGEHQRAFMEAMMEMHQPMMQGVMAEDPDIAFACGMIPHHQAAIAMAEVELQHGDDERMNEMAQSIIDAQKQEIEELTSWLEEQAQ